MEKPKRRPVPPPHSTKINSPALAVRFLDSLEDTLHRIQRHPLAYRQVENEIRKCRVARFPYGVIYRVQSGCIEIIAVMHVRRSPGYWKQRT